MNNKKQYGML